MEAPLLPFSAQPDCKRYWMLYSPLKRRLYSALCLFVAASLGFLWLGLFLLPFARF